MLGCIQQPDYPTENNNFTKEKFLRVMVGGCNLNKMVNTLKKIHCNLKLCVR